MNKQKILNILKNTASVVVIIAMFVVIFYQNRDRDIFKFGKEESSKFISSNQNVESAFSGGDIGVAGDSAAFLTTTAYSVVDKNGNADSFPIAISNPALYTKGEWAACFENDSKEITVFKNEAHAYSVKTDNKIITAKINKNGYLFAVTEKEGYSCECVVYNRNGEAIFKWDVSKSEFLDGDINSVNNKIAISLASAGKDKLIGEVCLIDVTTAEVIKKETFDSEMYYSLTFNSNDTYTLLGDSSLAYFNSDGTVRWTYSFGKKNLVKADVSDHDKLILAFSSAGALSTGKETEIEIINKLGKVTAQKNYDGIVDAISQNEDSIALAFGKKVLITNAKLGLKKTTESDFNVKKIVLFGKDNLFALGNSGGKIVK